MGYRLPPKGVSFRLAKLTPLLFREALLNGKRGDQRKVALYFLKKYTGITNGEIGSILGGISYSAVAKAYRRFSEKLKGDRKLKKSISGILSNVKG